MIFYDKRALNQDLRKEIGKGQLYLLIITNQQQRIFHNPLVRMSLLNETFIAEIDYPKQSCF